MVQVKVKVEVSAIARLLRRILDLVTRGCNCSQLAHEPS
jgi:hypothetical protein